MEKMGHKNMHSAGPYHDSTATEKEKNKPLAIGEYVPNDRPTNRTISI